MIKGTNVSLRPIAAADLEKLYSKLIDIEGRGPWYPLSRGSLTGFRRRFEEDGRMSDGEGVLFDTQPINRLHLTIHVDNIGSHHVAEKCGFIKEGMSREAWYHKGKRHDIDVYTLTRAESGERRRTDEPRP